MRGDDFIGAGYDEAGEKLWLLTGEAKSNKVLGRAPARCSTTITPGCTPDSLLFVANRLLESTDPDDNILGRNLRDEVGLKSLRADRIDHMLFAMATAHTPRTTRTSSRQLPCRAIGFSARVVDRAEPSPGARFRLGLGVDGVISMVSPDASGKHWSSAGARETSGSGNPDPG